jgi:Tfp pilus assembly protein PilO
MKAPTGRERALIVLAVVVATIIGLWVYAIEPLQEWRRTATDLVPTREALLERRRLLVGQRPVLAAELENVEKRLGAKAERLLKGPTPPLAASELQTLVKDLAEKAGAEMRSERILPLVDRGGLQEVPIEITVAAGLRETVRLLYELEGTTKILTLQDLKIRVVAAGQPRDLLTTFIVSGYLAPGAAAPATGEAPTGPSRG